MPAESAPLLAYRQFHEETNIASVVRVALAEFALDHFASEERGQELELHGRLQRGRYLEGRGVLLQAALGHLRSHGLRCELLHDGVRTQALGDQVARENPEFTFQLVSDLSSPAPRPVMPARDLTENGALLLVEARPARGRLRLHVLLARRREDTVQVMNSETGRNHRYAPEELARHLGCPLSFGATAFAGGLYLFTGLAVSLVNRTASKE